MTTVLPKPLPTYRLFVGIDIAAATAKAAWLSPGTAVTRAITIDQTPQAFAALQQRLLATGYPAHVILVVQPLSMVDNSSPFLLLAWLPFSI